MEAAKHPAYDWARLLFEASATEAPLWEGVGKRFRRFHIEHSRKMEPRQAIFSKILEMALFIFFCVACILVFASSNLMGVSCRAP